MMLSFYYYNDVIKRKILITEIILFAALIIYVK